MRIYVIIKINVNKIKNFIPEIGHLTSDIKFSAHNFKTDGKK